VAQHHDLKFFFRGLPESMPAALRELRAPRGPSNMVLDDLLVLSGEGEDSTNLDWRRAAFRVTSQRDNIQRVLPFCRDGDCGRDAPR
jgi:hypothetical protein